MPHFTLGLTSEGPVIDLVVMASQPRADALKSAGLPIPTPVALRCLIDTGASGTCFDAAAIAPLGLSPTGTTPISTPSTGAVPHQCESYDVSVLFYHPDNSRYFGTLPVIAIDFSAQRIDGLIGRDILASCLFVYDGGAQSFAIAF